MDLNQFSRDLLNSYPYNPYFDTQRFRDRGFRENPDSSIRDLNIVRDVYRVIGDRDSAMVAVANVFWEIITSSSFFEVVLNRMGIRNPLTSGGRMILTMTNLGIDRYDLLILSPDLRPGQFYSSSLRELLAVSNLYFESFYQDLLKRWRSQQAKILNENSLEKRYIDNARLLQPFFRTGDFFVDDIIRAQDFAILFGPMPGVTYTSSVGSPGCSIALQFNEPPVSSVGVVATNKGGLDGVTASLHGVFENPEELSAHFNINGLSGILNKTVYVDGKPGKIVSANYLTDSCFIGIDTSGIATNSIRGPLQHRGPYQGEKVTFESFRNFQSTAVTEVDIGITSIINNRQVRLYTRPVTNPGDSGSALLNSEGYALGFSHLRTGLGEDIEFAEWIWADSVFRALELHS